MKTHDITLSEYQSAYRRVIKNEQIFGFKIHIGMYIFFNAFMIAINFLTDPGYLWFYYPLFGWGIGLIMHSIFGIVYLHRDMDRKEALAEKRAREQMAQEKNSDDSSSASFEE